MTALLQFSFTSISPLNTIHSHTCKKPFNFHHPPSSKVAAFDRNRFKVRVFEERWRLLSGISMRGKGGFFVEDEGVKRERGRRVVLVRSNQGLGSGGGGDDEGDGTGRLLGNIALAVGLTYLLVTGQLGWVFAVTTTSTTPSPANQNQTTVTEDEKIQHQASPLFDVPYPFYLQSIERGL